MANTTTDSLPVPFVTFLRSMFEDGAFVMNGFLTAYQLNRVDLDNYGAFLEIDEK